LDVGPFNSRQRVPPGVFRSSTRERNAHKAAGSNGLSPISRGNEAPVEGNGCTRERAGTAIREHLLPTGDQSHDWREEK